MRRGLAALLLPFLLCVGAANAQTMVSVDRDLINMRDGAGTRTAALWQLARGYPLQVVARRGGWLKVKDFEGDGGWVLARLTANKPHVIVKVPLANLRAKAGTRGRVTGRVEHGEILKTLKRSGNWLHVRTQNGHTGWISRSLVWGW